MKKSLLLLILLLSSQMFAKVTIDEKQDNKPVEVKPVEIKLKKGSSTNDDTRPRTLIPIICIYADGTVQFTFMEDLGELEISVTNLSTGAEIIDEIDSFCGNALLEVPESSGEYQIEITTETGDSYYGEYIL